MTRSIVGFYVNQEKYVMDILTETRMLAVKPSVGPIEQNHKLIDDYQSYLVNMMLLYTCIWFDV